MTTTEPHRVSSGRLKPVTLVDSNVLIDVAREDPEWFTWSESALRRAADEGPLRINPVIYAEFSAVYSAVEKVDTVLREAKLVRADLPWQAAFLAGRAHLEYRRRGGARDRTLPDFLIGAHASVLGFRLLTRDPTRYRTYFPKLVILAPSAGSGTK